MPSVAIRAQGRSTPQLDRRRTTITSTNGTVTFAITNPEVLVGNVADRWVEVPRPGQKPYLERAGSRLRTLRLDILLDSAQPGFVQAQLVALMFMAAGVGPGKTCVLAYSAFESNQHVTATGTWVITDLDLRSVKRAPGSNEITRARMSLTLTEASPAQPADPGVLTLGRAQDPAGKVRPRRHVLRRGQTLQDVARRFYGDRRLWTRIAAANGIIDPRRRNLPYGTTLILP